jgi:hypothetical protein
MMMPRFLSRGPVFLALSLLPLPSYCLPPTAAAYALSGMGNSDLLRLLLLMCFISNADLLCNVLVAKHIIVQGP